MNQDKFKERLLMKTLAELHKKSPDRLQRMLLRAGFRPGDITFRVTKTGRVWTELHRWPWDPR